MSLSGVPSIALAALLLLGATGRSAAQQVETGQEGAPQSSSATSPGERPTRRGADESKPPRVWWNHPKIEARLALTDEQRSELDGKARAYASQRKAIAERRLDLNRRMVIAIRAGNLEAARQIAGKFEEFPNEAVEETRFRLDVLETLNESQLAFLVEEHSAILEEPWRSGGYALVRAGNHPRRGAHGHDRTDPANEAQPP